MIRHLLAVVRIRLNRTMAAHALECLSNHHTFALYFPPGWGETTPNIYRKCIWCPALEPDERPWLFVRRAG